MSSGKKENQTLYLKDYLAPAYLFPETDLTFDLLSEEKVIVSSSIKVVANPAHKTAAKSLILQGAPEFAPEGAETPTMELVKLMIDDQSLSPSQYQRNGESLVIEQVPESTFILKIVTIINPLKNRSLNGLYTSGGKFATQCEAHGFRNITFYQDRPDILSKFKTTIIAPKGKYTQLLSNGNPLERKDLEKGRECITWVDPFPKPCYLFALVAGNLDALRDQFKTKSGRTVDLVIYTDKGDSPKAVHAMKSLKQSMQWDEEKFGREYDLDLFQIVAVSDFNFGAMENKGLNIFNSQAVLADPKIATDARYESIQAIVAHEYFHNWSGNRVTCRDWFQLSLKEGFTVFRDAEFTADLNSRPLKRIDDVSEMRARQFAEDASSMAHPIRPASVGSIENFYTATVYEKGAEVIRMLQTIVGPKAFRAGCDLYFDRHDGQAVTTEDFVKAIADAAHSHGVDVDLKQFEDTWYNQAGTPVVTVTDEYNQATGDFSLRVKQCTPPTPGQATKKPFHIPIKMGFLDPQGNEISLAQGNIIHLRSEDETFEYGPFKEKPIPSLLRNWSAPVKINYDYSFEDLAFLMMHDTDGFNRWEAGQKLIIKDLQNNLVALRNKKPTSHHPLIAEAFSRILNQKDLDPAFKARSLHIPSAQYLAELYPDGEVDPKGLCTVRQSLREHLGRELASLWLSTFNSSRQTEQRPYEWNHKDSGERSLKNTALSYLVAGSAKEHLGLVKKQFNFKHNITDVRIAFKLILDYADQNLRDQTTELMFAYFEVDPASRTQWFADQASADYAGVLKRVESLLHHNSYESKNPNNIRSLVGAFADNMPHFHNADGSGYRFLADQIIAIDKFNPMAAAGLAKRLSTPNRFDAERKSLILKEWTRILAEVKSLNVQEIGNKTLGSQR